jgi:hypothetical protein
MLFSPKVYLNFTPNREYFDLMSFIRYGNDVLKLHQKYISLVECSSLSNGLITLSDLETFVSSHALKCSTLSNLRKSRTELDLYSNLVSVIFGIHFDPFSLNCLSIPEIITSSIFYEFLNVDKFDRKTTPFSYMFFYTQCQYFFQAMDKDNYISKNGFMSIGKWKFTQVFTQRIFDSVPLIEGKLNFVGFIKFMYIFEHIEISTCTKFMMLMKMVF